MSEILTTDEIENMTERLAWTGEHRQEADAYVAIVASHEALRAENAALKKRLAEIKNDVNLVVLSLLEAGYGHSNENVAMLCEILGVDSEMIESNELAKKLAALLNDAPDEEVMRLSD